MRWACAPLPKHGSFLVPIKRPERSFGMDHCSTSTREMCQRWPNFDLTWCLLRLSCTLLLPYPPVPMISIPNPQNAKNTRIVNQTWMWAPHIKKLLYGSILRMRWISGSICPNVEPLFLVLLDTGVDPVARAWIVGTGMINMNPFHNSRVAARKLRRPHE